MHVKSFHFPPCSSTKGSAGGMDYPCLKQKENKREYAQKKESNLVIEEEVRNGFLPTLQQTTFTSVVPKLGEKHPCPSPGPFSTKLTLGKVICFLR